MYGSLARKSINKILIKETTTSKYSFDVAQLLPSPTGGRWAKLGWGTARKGAVGCISMHQLTSPPDGGARGGSSRRETAHLFNILFSSPSLVFELKAEPIKTKQPPAQGLRKQYIEQEQHLPLSKGVVGCISMHHSQNNLPLSKGEDAVVFAQASYKCGVRVYPVGKLGGDLC